ncbi:hypothetical protein BB987_17320 [Photorhabdus temperata]|nr:hypothetical protein BB987_17320 [Photorhabdus temperata]
MKNLNITKENAIALIVLSIIYTIPIILANVYYTDDMKRIIYGYGWDHDGRFIASYLMMALSFGDIIVSSYPFSLIMSSLIILASGVIITNTLDLEKNLKIKLSPLILLVSPFFLENLAYRYDNIPMSLSILFALLPFVFFTKKYFIPVSIACLFLSFGSYQTSVMIYFSMLTCIQIKNLTTNNTKILFNLLFSCVISFILAYFLYKKSLDLLGIELSRSKIMPINNFIVNIKERIERYFHIFNSLFYQSKYIYAAFPLLLLCIISLFENIIKNNKSLSVMLFKFLSIFFLYILVCIIMLIPNIILDTIWYTARTMIGFPFAIYALLIFIPYLYKKYIKIIYYSSISLLLYFCFLFSSLFGEVLKNNNDYFNFITESVSMQITNNSNNKEISIAISGSAPIPERSKLIYKNYPFLYILAPFYMIEGWSWGVSDLSRYINYSWSENTDQMINDRCTMDILYKSSIYFLRKKNDDYLIDFNMVNCK